MEWFGGRVDDEIIWGEIYFTCECWMRNLVNEIVCILCWMTGVLLLLKLVTFWGVNIENEFSISLEGGWT